MQKTKIDSTLHDWYHGLTVGDALKFKQLLREKLNWSRHTWHSRLSGKVECTEAEKLAINYITKQSVFK